MGIADLAGQPQDAAFVSMTEDGIFTFPFWVVAVPGQWRPPGLYQGQLPVRMVDANGQVLARREMAVRAYIDSVLKVDFSSDSGRSTGSSMNLQFSEMRTGAKQYAAIAVRANAPYELSVSSMNGGRLLHESGAPLGVPYQTTVNGQLMPSGGRATFPASLSDQAYHTLEFTIGAMEQAWAGRYRDTLTVQVTAR